TLHPHFPEAPRPYHLCEDSAVIGAIFFVMEYRPGSILRNEVPASWRATRDHARLISEAFVDCQVRLHSIDVTHRDFAGLGRPEGFLERQVQGWRDRWDRARTDEILDMDSIGDWLTRHLHNWLRQTLFQTDYKRKILFFDPLKKFKAWLNWRLPPLAIRLAVVGL